MCCFLVGLRVQQKEHIDFKTLACVKRKCSPSPLTPPPPVRKFRGILFPLGQEMEYGNSTTFIFYRCLTCFCDLDDVARAFYQWFTRSMFKDPSNPIYSFWLYCRGFTAPVFFTITGWVFTFLLLRNPVQGWKNPRVKKGLKRTLELLFWGYLLRLNLPMLLNGQINNSFIYPDVLQIIGLSLSLTILLYGCFHFMQRWAGLVFLLVGTVDFYHPTTLCG